MEAQRLYRKLIKRRNTRDDILPKIENDPRVTRVGRFLRKTSLDELPNIFCIFLGSMSFVGPRPHLPNEVEKYEPWMRRLFSAKPGMTGYAQIFGRDSLPFREEAKLDLYYIQNWSIAMDLHVLLSTIKVVFAGR
ncbi:MAG: sugar transferase [bacterium]